LKFHFSLRFLAAINLSLRCNIKKIPLVPPFSKGELADLIPLFGKEG
jgi:hypothetical protein